MERFSHWETGLGKYTVSWGAYNLDGRKDVLGMWVGENESAKFWATVLNGLKNRGVEDIFIACTDNLTGFDAAICKNRHLSPTCTRFEHHPAGVLAPLSRTEAPPVLSEF
ncbi:transposase [Faecalibacterium sp. An121]|uniref:transposase n=1 Tax=Faecalibacterium sp. An121 TaxID=1965550 RepID=UPI0031450DDD